MIRMRELFAAFVLSVMAFGCLLAPAGAKTGDRVALIIGNANYQNITPLKNPVNDARAVAAKLKGLGFAVTALENATGRQMNRAISTWLGTTEPGQTAVLYYAGHGVELRGRNYLLPVDVPHLRVGQERELRREGIVLDDLLADLIDAPASRGIVILDACRDNPLTSGTRSVGGTRGMARVDNPYGTFVLYAAGARQTALDETRGNQENGLFTRSLLAHLDEPDLELRRLARKVREDVSAKARERFGHVQIPSYYDQMSGDFYFRPAQQSVALSTPPPAPAADEKPKPWSARQIENNLNGKTLVLPNGDAIYFSKDVRTTLTAKLGRDFLKRKVRKDVVVQVPFLARRTQKSGTVKYFEGVAGITATRANAGSVIVLFETTSKDTTFKSFARRDRLFASLRIAEKGGSTECTRSKWQSLKKFKRPLKVSTERCTLSRGNRTASQ